MNTTASTLTAAAWPAQAAGAQPAAAVVHARGLVRRYGRLTALAGLDVDIQPGRVTTLLGPNGAGKSTLVNLVLGRLRADAGTLRVAGHVPGSLAARRLTGAMLQAAALAPQLTVHEHVALHSRYHPAARPLAETMALAGLQDLAGRRYEALSGGQQRRVQFALALAGRPRLLVLDEPTAALDAESRRALWQAVRALADEGSAVLLTTHLLEEAEALSDRVLLLAGGRVVADGTPGEIRARVAARWVRCVSTLPLPRLQALPGVQAATAEGRRVALRTTAAEATLRALLAEDAAVADIEVTGTSLEDAVLDLLKKEAA
jgi:ABC-2 type transport system ATP-binding protein